MMTFMGSILTNHDRSQMLDKCCLSISQLKTQIMITIFIVLNIIFCTTLVYYQEDPDMCPCVYDQDDLMEVIMKCDLTTDHCSHFSEVSRPCPGHFLSGYEEDNNNDTIDDNVLVGRSLSDEN